MKAHSTQKKGRKFAVGLTDCGMTNHDSIMPFFETYLCKLAEEIANQFSRCLATASLDNITGMSPNLEPIHQLESINLISLLKIIQRHQSVIIDDLNIVNN